MEDLPRKAGFVNPTGGKSIKPSIFTDASVKVSRVEASPSQVASVTPEDLELRGEELAEGEEDLPWRPRTKSKTSTISKAELRGEELAEGEEDLPWRPRTKSKTKTISKAELRDQEYLDGSFVEDEVVIVLPEKEKHKQKQRWKVGAIVAAAVGALGSAALWMYSIRPRDPAFKVELITLNGFNIRFCTDSPLLLAVVDISLTLHVNSTNPNVSPIVFYDTIMDIYYRGNLLGQAKVPAGDQAALSAKTMELPCKLDGLELTNHFKDFFCDVTKREMMLHSVVTISGESLVWKWRHPFQVHVESDLKVDPIFFNVLDQENTAKLEMAPDWRIKCEQ